MNSFRITALVALFASLVTLTSVASADPLQGQVLKFQQLPLNNGVGPSVGGAPYAGHDEWSTAYAEYDLQGLLVRWRGTYAADDFGDLVSTPVVHIRWWGSYQNNIANAGVQKFLISFESDVPATTVAPIIPSHPGAPLSNQIVTAGPLSPGSGTFTEKLINGSVPEHLYEYNAELNLGQEFFETAHDVYWLKIVALVDPNTEGMINWGWHNRDYTFQDTLASTTFPSSPGETLLGNAGGLPVWHFQDDAVEGLLDIEFNAASPGGLNVIQHTWQEQYYLDGIDGPAGGIPGQTGIGQFSKDLAFELYTTPEPSTIVLLAMGAVGLGAGRWLRRRQSA